MPKFKPGDIVRVREDLEEGEAYQMENDDGSFSSFCAVGDMLDHRGECMRVTYACDDYYTLADSMDEDTGYVWTDQMFDESIIAPEDETEQPEELSVLYDWVSKKAGEAV